MLLLRLFGLFLLRLAERTLLELLFHEPPRNVSTTPRKISPCGLNIAKAKAINNA